MIVDARLTGEFEGGRHQRRIDMIRQIEARQLVRAEEARGWYGKARHPCGGGLLHVARGIEHAREEKRGYSLPAV